MYYVWYRKRSEVYSYESIPTFGKIITCVDIHQLNI